MPQPLGPMGRFISLAAFMMVPTGCVSMPRTGEVSPPGSSWNALVHGAPPRPAPVLHIPGPGQSAPVRLAQGPAAVPSPAPPGAGPPGQGVVAAMPLLAAGPQTPPDPVAPLRDLHQKAARKHATLDSYILRMRRREVVNGQNRPEEVMLCKFRQEPRSVYFKWLGTEGQGREVVYVKGRYGNVIHTLTAAGDVIFLGAGMRFRVPPDSFMVKSKSRYPITEAGLGPMIDRFGRLVDAVAKGDKREGTAKHLGQLKRPEFETKVEGVLQIIPPKSDPHLPRGGQRHWFFDPALHLPVLVVTQDETGREVEFYCHDRFEFPVRLDDDDFNPDVLWKKAS